MPLVRRILFVFAVLALPLPLSAADWKPVDRAELDLAAPKVQPDADAEAIFWEVRIADQLDMNMTPATVFEHYLRIKIFTERGRAAYATVDIPYATGTEVSDVDARSIGATGSILELKKSDIYRRTILKAEGFKVDAVSFAIPGIVPGAIVEYRWRERHRNRLANFLRLPFSRELPIHVVRYFLRPLSTSSITMAMNYIPFNATPTRPEHQKDGYAMISLANVPAVVDEPFSPPQYERRPWMFIYYGARNYGADPDFWKRIANSLYDDYQRRSKPNGDIRKIVAAVVTSEQDIETKIIALVRAARERIRRIDVDTADPIDARKARENRYAAEALERGVGTGDDVIVLFLALASAAGLDARIAAAPDRADLFHKPSHRHPYFVRHRLAAVRSGNAWIFVDPANEHAHDGALRWNLEDEEVLIGDPQAIVTAKTPLSPPMRSVKRRTGEFTLTADGVLEGDCRVEYTGHWSDVIKEEDDHETPGVREKNYLDTITRRVASAEISSLQIEHVTEPGKNYRASYHIRVSGFAQRTGTRLIFQPAVFQKGSEVMFSAQTRVSDVYFPFPWTESDDFRIRLPEGFELEQPQSPTDITADVGSHELLLGLTDAGQTLTVKRRLTFGTTGILLFPSRSYSALKLFFDRAHAHDGHSLVLRKKERLP